MAASQNETVQTTPEVEAVDSVEESPVDSVEAVTAEGKRGRNPLTHSDVMKRLTAPNPIDASFGVFAAHKFGVYGVVTPDFDKLDEATQTLIGQAVILGGILGRWSTVVKWWNESDEQKTAKESVQAWAAEQEMAAKVAKLSPTEKAEFDSAPESVKAMILRFISL